MGVANDSGRVSTRVVSVFHFAAGRQLERWFYPDDMSVWDAIAAV